MGRSINVLRVYGKRMERKFVELSGDAKGNVKIFGNVGKLFPFSFEKFLRFKEMQKK
jgi:hypothetical protein